MVEAVQENLRKLSFFANLRILVLLGGAVCVSVLCVRRIRVHGARLKLRQFRAKFLGSRGEIMVELDGEGRVLAVSQGSWSSLDTRVMQKQVGENWVHWWVPASQEAARDAVRSAAFGTAPVHFEAESHLDLCESTWWDILVCPGGNLWGGSGRGAVIMLDISSKRGLQRALEESESRFVAFMRQTSAIAYIKDVEGRYVFANRVYEELCGVGTGEMVGLPEARGRCGVDFEKARVAEAEVFSRGVSTRTMEEFRTAGGELRYWRMVRFPLWSRGKRLLGALGMDVTRSIQVEAELKEARDAALRAVQLKGDFLAQVSHEIRTPLNGIVGMSRLLQQTALDARQRDFVETLVESSDALVVLLNDVLDFSKMEAGMLFFEEAEFELEGVLKGAADLFAERASAKGLDFAVVWGEGVPEVWVGDAGRVRQVLVNLLSNAFKFTRQGSVVLECRLVRPGEAGSGGMVRFEVRDTGIGMSAEVQSRLFAPFMQAEPSIARWYGGTGLGLAISKQLVERMRGEVGVQSRPGWGSHFWFTLPLPPGGVAPRAPCLLGMQVLVGECFEPQRRGLAALLRAEGAEVSEALGVSGVLDWCERKSGGVVLLDEVLWERMGAAETPRLRGGRRRTLGLLAGVTKMGLTPAQERAGFQKVFFKPFCAKAVLDWLRSLPKKAALWPMEKPQPQMARECEWVPLKVLVVDDCEVNQKVLLHSLDALGFDAVWTASNGLQALSVLERQEVDVLLLDCQMPEMDGVTLARRIRGRPGAGAGVWIIAVTAGTEGVERKRCLEAGMDDFLEKPIRLDALEEALRRAPKPSQAGRAA
ncbi:MAG: hypothetical protein RLZZ399_2990, partial [Verrucomicrobiota bacterium]